jgi:hypothetical protein
LPPSAIANAAAAIATVFRGYTLVLSAIGAMNPTDLEVKACVDLAFLWQLEQPQQVVPHPSLVVSSSRQTENNSFSEMSIKIY